MIALSEAQSIVARMRENSGAMATGYDPAVGASVRGGERKGESGGAAAGGDSEG